MNRREIENVLLKIGVPTGIKGFRYITDAVLILNENPDISITKELYPTIANKNNTTGSRVERAIRHAFEIARSAKGDYHEAAHYIGFIHCTNASSLKMLHMRIEQECENNVKQTEITTGEILDKEKIRQIVAEELKKLLGGIA